MINAYPAALGRFPNAVAVDTFLSHRTLSRSLQLAAREGIPAILVGQPLFLADALLAHVDSTHPLPRTLLLAVGGYLLPRSLEVFLRQ